MYALSNSQDQQSALDAHGLMSFNADYATPGNAGADASIPPSFQLAAATRSENLESGSLSDVAWRNHAEGNDAYQRGDFGTAAELLERSRAMFETAGDRNGVAWSYNNLGKVAYRTGDYANATRFAKSSLQMFHDRNDRHGVAWSLHVLGRIDYRLGNYASALARFQECVTHFRAISGDEALRLSLEKLGKTYFRIGDLASASKTYAEALELNKAAHDDNGIQACLESLVHIAYKQDKPMLTDLLLAQSRGGYAAVAGTPPYAAITPAGAAATGGKQQAVWNQCLITMWKEMF
jgi:tetratricopeptide (TPR) repeat protein